MLPVFVSWYYQDISKRILSYFKVWFFHLYDLFSVKIILKTYFAPWKRDLLSARNLPLNERVSVWWMNIISRLIGVFIKTATLIAFLISVIGWLVFSLTYFIGWLLFPIILIILFIGVSNFI